MKKRIIYGCVALVIIVAIVILIKAFGSSDDSHVIDIPSPVVESGEIVGLMRPQPVWVTITDGAAEDLEDVLGGKGQPGQGALFGALERDVVLAHKSLQRVIRRVG